MRDEGAIAAGLRQFAGAMEANNERLAGVESELARLASAFEAEPAPSPVAALLEQIVHEVRENTAALRRIEAAQGCGAVR